MKVLNTWLVKTKAMVAGLKWLACFADQGKGNAGRFLKWTGAETCPEKKIAEEFYKATL